MGIVNHEREERTREIIVRVAEGVYRKLEEESRRQGFSTVAEYVLHVLLTYIRPEKDLASEVLEKLRGKIERIIQDELNKRLTQLEAFRKQLIEVYEKVDILEQRISELESKIKDVESRKIEISPRQKTRKTAIERLKEERVLFESALPARINRDRLFAYLERSGAVIIKLSRERVAVDPEFWGFFKKKLDEIHTNDEKEILGILGDAAFKLWKALYSDNLVIYDSKLKKWRPVHGELP